MLNLDTLYKNGLVYEYISYILFSEITDNWVVLTADESVVKVFYICLVLLLPTVLFIFRSASYIASLLIKLVFNLKWPLNVLWSSSSGLGARDTELCYRQNCEHLRFVWPLQSGGLLLYYCVSYWRDGNLTVCGCDFKSWTGIQHKQCF